MEYNRICVLDTETTSVYWNSAAPVQIAAIIVDRNGNIIDSFEEKIKTTHKIDPDASKVHGIFAKDLKNCRRESEVLTDFCV
jgi:DNA polymerase III epsilon subunit-like protein